MADAPKQPELVAPPRLNYSQAVYGEQVLHWGSHRLKDFLGDGMHSTEVVILAAWLLVAMFRKNPALFVAFAAYLEFCEVMYDAAIEEFRKQNPDAPLPDVFAFAQTEAVQRPNPSLAFAPLETKLMQ